MLPGYQRAYLVTGMLILMVSCSIENSTSPATAYSPVPVPDLTPEQLLGQEIFSDDTLSEPAGQSCASCHDEGVGFASPPAIMTGGVSEGVVPGRFGLRNAPTAAYALFSPLPFFDPEPGTLVGGQFLDHRAADLEEQARGPFLNPDEMANPDRATVVNKLRNRPYADRFRALYGADVFTDVDRAYVAMSRAIAAYERSPEFSPFSSKFDAYIRGRANLSPAELRGLAVFRDPLKGNCEACHLSTGDAPLFTDFTNDNIGVPRNLTIPAYAGNPALVDRGLGAILNDAQYDGRFKVQTLRNVALTAPYMHNGVFTTLEDVVRFYNTACAPGNPDGWDAPEVPDTRNCNELGNLKLSDQEIADLVAFLHTLTDGYLPR